jgi:hypothetical protein
MPVANLDTHIAKLVMGADFDGSLGDFLNLAGEVSAEVNMPFIIIFDGINEHSQIAAFSGELERLIEKFIDFPFVKIILTCRSEYLTERFSNLQKASFADEVYTIPEIQHAMSRQHRQEMISVYFKFFRIIPAYMSGKVSETLGADPLLLRFFCEAYGNPEAKKPVRLPSMPDIYRDAVFRLYFEKKLKEVSERQDQGAGIGIQIHRAYKEVLRALVSVMVDRRTFSNIVISNLDAQHYPFLSELIAEDMFMRKDIIQGKSVLDPDAEVINFTFDEFRDYLLADHLLHVVWREVPKERFINFVREFTEKTCPVAEGVSRYLFYAVKRSGDEKLLEVLESMPWYSEIFLDCIFSVEDIYVVEDDIRKIRDAFSQNAWTAEKIVFALMVRWDVFATPRLNINLMFEIFNSLGDEQYNRFIRPLFEKSFDRYGVGSRPPYEIGRLVSDIKGLINAEGSQWDPKYEKISEFLIYLFPLEGEGYRFPAFDLFQEIAQKHRDMAVRQLMKHIDCQLSRVREKVWEMIVEAEGKGKGMPKWLIDKAESRLANYANCTSREIAEIRRLLKSKTGKLAGDHST